MPVIKIGIIVSFIKTRIMTASAIIFYAQPLLT